MSVLRRKQTGASYPWSQKKILISNPFPRYGHSASQNASNEFFLFGGISRGKSRNESFVVEVNTLNVLAFVTSGDIPLSRSGHTHVNIGKNVIVFGGLIDEFTNNADENLYILDTVSKVWSKPSVQGTLPLSRHGHSVSVIGTKMYVFGGQHAGRYLNDMIAFDIKTVKTGASWEFIVPVNQSPHARSGHVSFAYMEKIYVFGGIGEKKCYSDIWCFDTRTNTWTELSCSGYIPVPRYNHGSTIVDDIIYVFGGRTYDGQELGDLTAFRIINQRWYMFQKMGPAPSSRFLHTMTTSQNKIFVFGGESINSPKPDEEGIIHILDTSKIKYPSLSAPPANPQQVQQGLPQHKEKSPVSMSPQSSVDVIPMSRQGSISTTYDDDELIHSSKSSINEASSEVRQRQLQQAQNSFRSTRMSPENMEGGRGGGIYNQLPIQQGYPDYRQSIGGTQPSRGMPGYDINLDSKGNPSEQIERSVSSQQRSTISISTENLRKKTPSPFSSAIGGILRPILQPQRSNDNLKSQQQRSVKKQSIFENPRSAPQPPNNTTSKQINSTPYGITGVRGVSSTPSSPISINTNKSLMSNVEGNIYSSPIMNSSTTDTRLPTSDNVDHSPARILNAEGDERDQTIAILKKREMWFRAELALARKSGYILNSDFDDSPPPDGIDIEQLFEMGDPTSEKYKVLETILKHKQIIKKLKASVANQAKISSQKISDSERARTAALQEAAYLKAKLMAITNASESQLASIEIKRAKDLEKRLTQSLTEKEVIQDKFLQFQQNLDYEKTSRESAEERAKIATMRSEEAEGAHARVLAELATLHSRATIAESSLRESKAKLAETIADSTQYRNGNDNHQSQLSQLQQSIDQHKRALEKANDALTAANERTKEIETLWNQAKQEITNLEKEAASLRAELDVKIRDLDRSKVRTSDIEKLLEKAQKENEAMRVMMQEGMTKLLNSPKSNSANDTLGVDDKLKLREQELSELKLIHDEAQKTADEASSNLSGARIKMLQLESSVMKARSESAVLQRRLAESNDEIIRTKGRLRDKERILEEKSRALEDAEVKIGMMREVMTERGIFEESGKFSRLKEMEARCEELENIHDKTQAELKASIEKYKDALQKAKEAENKSRILEEELERTSNGGSKSLTPDISSNHALEDELRISEKKLSETLKRFDDTKQKLKKMESDYETATRYVKDTEKMLRRMKDELTRTQSEKFKINEQLSLIQEQNENLEDKVAELENQVSLQKGFRASRQDFANAKQLSELIKQIEHAREEKLMSDQSYEALRKEYDNIRKEHKLLRQTTDLIQEKLTKSEEEVKELQGELDETLSLNEFVNQQLDEALKNNGKLGGNLSERRISSINRELKWKDQRESFEKQIEELKVENAELISKLCDSESKVKLLLDQTEPVVDNYNEPSSRDSKIISSLTNELDILESKFETYIID